MKRALFIIVSLLIFSLISSAQTQLKFNIQGITQKRDIKAKRDVILPKTKIVIYKDDSNLTTKKSDEKGNFEISNLEYGHTYKLVFWLPGCVQMFMLVDANVPEKCMGEGFGTNVILIDTKDKSIDTTNFKYPFQIAGCINEKKFAIDEKYTDNFMKGIIPPEMKAAVEKAEKEKLAKDKAIADAAEQERIKNEKKRTEALELDKKKIKIAGKIIVGENPSKPVANITLKLTNEKGEIVQSVTTNFLGAFVFYILPNNNYDFTGEGSGVVQPGAKVFFTNKNDKEIQTNSADVKGNFKFNLLGSNNELLADITVNDNDLKMDLKGKLLSGDGPVSKPLAEIKINLLNPSSIEVDHTITDKEGNFAFTYLSSSEKYTIAIDENNPKLTSVKKIILADEKGKTVKEVSGTKLSDFKFEILPDDKNKMSTVYVDDPWLKIINLPSLSGSQTITERVYFNVDDDKLLPEAKKTLDKIITILKADPGISIELSSHTDSQGADDYNLKLSERRAKAAADYITANGIVAARVKAKGYGETQLLNKCINNVKCTEAEHALNRRLEFKVVKK